MADQCPGCGGTIGVDCWNPTECVAIAQQKAAMFDSQQSGDSAEYIEHLRRELDDARQELRARGEILTDIQAATGSGSWEESKNWANKVFAACIKADSTDVYESRLTRELVPAYIGQLAKERDFANQMRTAELRLSGAPAPRRSHDD